MTERFSTLQKKLRELESQILHFVTAVTTAENPIPKTLSEDIEQRSIFLNNLLSADIASSPSKPHHLHHVAHCLADLESTFRNVCNIPSAGLTHLETKSNCSCTESCLNEEEEKMEDYYAAAEELAAPEKEGRLCGIREWFIMGSGFIIGIVVMGFVMIQFCVCFHQFSTQEEGFVAPT